MGFETSFFLDIQDKLINAGNGMNRFIRFYNEKQTVFSAREWNEAPKGQKLFEATKRVYGLALRVFFNLYLKTENYKIIDS